MKEIFREFVLDITAKLVKQQLPIELKKEFFIDRKKYNINNKN